MLVEDFEDLNLFLTVMTHIDVKNWSELDFVFFFFCHVRVFIAIIYCKLIITSTIQNSLLFYVSVDLNIK